MTITLHWWAWPMLVVFCGFVYMVYDHQTDDGWLAGITGALVFMASIGIALGIVVGHFL